MNPHAPGGVSSVAAQTMQVDEIEVVGTQRVDPDTVRSYLTVKVGDTVDADALDRSLKALFEQVFLRMSVFVRLAAALQSRSSKTR